MNQKNSRNWKLMNGLFKASHYQSYHSYRRSVNLSKVLLSLAVIFAVIGLLPVRRTQALSLDLALMLIILYLLFSYWIMAKSNMMKQDSLAVLEQTSNYAGLSETVTGWNIYSGIDDEDDKGSLEISFFKERSFLGDMVQLIRGKGIHSSLESGLIKFFNAFY